MCTHVRLGAVGHGVVVGAEVVVVIERTLVVVVLCSDRHVSVTHRPAHVTPTAPDPR